MIHLENAIVERLRKEGPCCFDEVVAGLPGFSWGQIFAAVDGMSRDGRVLIRQLSYSTSSHTGQTTSNALPIVDPNMYDLGPL